ncbi:SOUL family heme-binding protein [Sphingomonas arenae]|uniref:SOUL family heme-binding protein n=1 Tax=Sphingomonas arenae TaxID=2812555 RepID=UPI00196725BC|nr:heme-binding protein [Sphingomonas arenae]
MRKDVAWGAAAGGLLVGLGIAYILREKATPEPDYRVLASEREFEIRSYPATRVAETVVQGPRKDALNEGYRILSDYLTAESRPGGKLPMWVPVFQDSGNPMASDPPTFDDDLGEGGWRVRLTLPQDEELPHPPEGVALVEIPARRVGVARFSGTANDDRLAAHEDALRGWLSRHGEKALHAEPEYAFYNSPMIPPPLRRVEVLLPLT